MALLLYFININIYIYILFIAGFCKEAEKETEGDGGGDSACSGTQAPDKDAEKPKGIDRLLHSFGKGIAKAGKGDSGACLTEIDEGIIKTKTGESDPDTDIEDGNACRCPLGFIDEDLGDGAEGTAHKKDLQVRKDGSHLVFSFQMDQVGNGGDRFPLQNRNGAHQCAGGEKEDVFPFSFLQLR